MRLIQANKILLASCVVVVPCECAQPRPLCAAFLRAAELTPHPTVSIYAGVALKERYLAKELATVPDESQIVKERAVRARIAQWVGRQALGTAQRADARLQVGAGAEGAHPGGKRPRPQDCRPQEAHGEGVSEVLCPSTPLPLLARLPVALSLSRQCLPHRRYLGNNT